MVLTVASETGATPGTPGGKAMARNGAEALIQLMVAEGVQYIFLNPGTDTAPIQEAVVALRRDGQIVPEIVPCMFENVAKLPYAKERR